jgi:hypothetical protein
MSIELDLVLAPLFLSLVVAPGQLPAGLANGVRRIHAKSFKISKRFACHESEAMVRIAFPDPVGADFGDISKSLLAFAKLPLHLLAKTDVGRQLRFAPAASPDLKGQRRQQAAQQ